MGWDLFFAFTIVKANGIL